MKLRYLILLLAIVMLLAMWNTVNPINNNGQANNSEKSVQEENNGSNSNHPNGETTLSESNENIASNLTWKAKFNLNDEGNIVKIEGSTLNKSESTFNEIRDFSQDANFILGVGKDNYLYSILKPTLEKKRISDQCIYFMANSFVAYYYGIAYFYENGLLKSTDGERGVVIDKISTVSTPLVIDDRIFYYGNDNSLKSYNMNKNIESTIIKNKNNTLLSKSIYPQALYLSKDVIFYLLYNEFHVKVNNMDSIAFISKSSITPIYSRVSLSSYTSLDEMSFYHPDLRLMNNNILFFDGQSGIFVLNTTTGEVKSLTAGIAGDVFAKGNSIYVLSPDGLSGNSLKSSIGEAKHRVGKCGEIGIFDINRTKYTKIFKRDEDISTIDKVDSDGNIYFTTNSNLNQKLVQTKYIYYVKEHKFVEK